MRPLTLAFTAILAFGCSTKATIYLKDGTSIEGEIKQSDRLAIYVKSNDSDRVVPIYRGSIKEIDHPGNVGAIIGTSLVLTGLTAVTLGIVNAVECDGGLCGIGTAILTVPGIVIAFPSTIAAIWGWSTWAGSRSAAALPEVPVGPTVIPVALTDGEKIYWGVGMSWSW